MSSTVSRTVNDVEYSVTVPETIAAMREMGWTDEQIDAAANRGVREMFGTTLQTRLKKGETIEAIQNFFNTEWHPGMAPERQKLSAADRAIRNAEKMAKDKTPEQIKADLDAQIKALQNMRKSVG